MTQHVNKPMEVSEAEWQEILQLPVIRESWGLTNEGPAEFASMVYGVKFDFISGGPGYCGELFIIQGDVLTGDAPFIFGRVAGKLQPI